MTGRKTRTIFFWQHFPLTYCSQYIGIPSIVFPYGLIIRPTVLSDFSFGKILLISSHNSLEILSMAGCLFFSFTLFLLLWGIQFSKRRKRSNPIEFWDRPNKFLVYINCFFS